MKLAIMQPYLFPYIGYFQLINAVDKFVVYDDVAFIKQGWINRNNILVNGAPFLFSIPVKNISSFVLIKDVEVDINKLSFWKLKFLKTIELNYKKAPNFEFTYQLLNRILATDETHIVQINLKSIVQLCEHLDIKTTIVNSSTIYNNAELKSVQRVIDICKKENATHYINAIGGKDIYSKELFNSENINLKFIQSNQLIYKQFDKPFVANLSIIDLLMFNDKKDIQTFINNYILV